MLTVLDFMYLFFLGRFYGLLRNLSRYQSNHTNETTVIEKEITYCLFKGHRAIWMLCVFAFESAIAKTWGRRTLVTSQLPGHCSQYLHT